MNQYKRPEKETDPAKMPGQIVNRPWYEGIKVQEPTHFEKPLRKEIEEYQAVCGYEKMADGCCHKTVYTRCSDCSFRDPETGSIGSPPKNT